jgi:hypothetical protein
MRIILNSVGGMDTAIDIAEQLRDLSSRLEATDLRPGPEVNEAFEELVGITLSARPSVAGDVLRLLGARVDTIRSLCAAGESELETAWSDRIATASDPWEELWSFPYAQNYRDLVDLELAALRGLGQRPQRIVMIGSGPLPLTGVVLAHDHGLDVVLIDRDVECLDRGRALLQALGLDEITCAQVDVGTESVELGSADLVVLAALVGADGLEKRTALSRIAASMRDGAHLVVRSASGLRELLYPPASLYDVEGLSMLLELHPHHEVVNSMLVARRDLPSR